MAIRNQNKTSTASIVPGVRLDLNPFNQRVGTARLLQNWLSERNRLMRLPYHAPFIGTSSAASGQVWAIVDLAYHRSNAPESQCLVFRSDGKIYRRTGGSEVEIFPGVTSYSVLNARPRPVVLSNRLFFSDQSNSYVYDGRTFRAWGIVAPVSAPTTSVIAGSGLTAASGLSASITWVVLDEAGNRVHESTHSPASAFSAALSDQAFRISISGISPPAGVTHWSGYMSELDGSGIRRRVNTTAITTLTYDVSSLPSGTDPIEPIRNDPPPASTVMGQWRNRIAMRNELDKTQMWFTAYGEVLSTDAGSCEESVPGYGAASISDLSNEIGFPQSDLRLILEHDNMLAVFTDTAGYVVLGTGGILDNVGTRGLSSEHFISLGAAGPHAGNCTPYGLAWMTSGRRVVLWQESQLLDIGDAIQPQLRTIPPDALSDTSFFWWDGNGRRWLCVCLKCADADDLYGDTSWRLLIYDFALGSEADHPGEWCEWTDHEYTTVSSYQESGQLLLLAGDADGDIYQLDALTQPSHLDRSMVLGKAYLGDSVEDNPACKLRTGLIIPNEDRNAVGVYVSLVKGTQDGPSADCGIVPTVTSAIDPINPDTAPGIELTPDQIKDSGEYLAWLMPEPGGAEGGALAKQFQFELSYPAGASNNGEADGRLTAAYETVYKLAFAWQPAADIKS